MALDKTKLESYAKKVYNGDLKRFKEKQKKESSFTFDLFLKNESKATKEKRVNLNSSIEKVVIEDCKKQCVICGKEYNDPDDFDIHHVNGDRSNPDTSNLVLVCQSCHKKLHRHARVKLSNYKAKNKNSSSKTQSPFNSPSIGSPFDTAPKKKGRTKKKDDDPFRLW
ncbi:MAG: HNH endonuclease [Methanosarcinaceae archaeon]|nr:HNH endonuclease [Methanosarcinaceae archaeon]